MNAEVKFILNAYMNFINKRVNEGLMDNEMVRHSFSYPAMKQWLHYNYPDKESDVDDFWLAFNESYDVQLSVKAR